MTFTQWLTEYKQARGIKSVQGQTKMLKLDYEEGMSPREAADRWSGKTAPRGPFTLDQLDRWGRALS